MGWGRFIAQWTEWWSWQVAIKVLKPEIAGNPEVLGRFRSEAVTLARLNHPSIATLYSFFRQEDEYFMVMEFVPGRTLEEVIRSEGALPWRVAVDLLIHLLEALQHAHFLGILHRDIKPANIMLTSSRGVKVTDFGIARALGSARLTREGRMVGTLEYLVPERVMGAPFERSDLYSAGVVFYEMLSGHVPFESDSDYALIRAQAEQQPPPLAQFGVAVPQPVVDVLLKSLEKNPEERYPNAAAMAAALLDAKIRAESAGPVIKETRLAEQPRVPPVQRKSRLIWIFAAAALLIFTVLAGFLYHGQSVAAKQAAEQAQARVQQAAAEQAMMQAAPPAVASPPVAIAQPPSMELPAPAPAPVVEQEPPKPRRRQPQEMPRTVSQVQPKPADPAPAVEPPPALTVAASPPPTVTAAIQVNPAPVAREIPPRRRCNRFVKSRRFWWNRCRRGWMHLSATKFAPS